MKFKKLESGTINKIETKISKKWDKMKILDRSIENRNDRDNWVFYDGPATANGMPGVHHMMAKILKDSFCKIYNGELYALGIHISPYEKGNIFNKDALREKKLLMHKKEIMRLNGNVARDGYSLIPLSLYFSGSKVKAEIGLCKGKKLYDKRDSDAKKSAERTIERTMKGQRDEI